MKLWRRNQKHIEKPAKRGPVPITKTERFFYGATYLLDQIGQETGITSDLKTCFPKTYKQILSVAYYLILEDQNPLFRFKKWAKLHMHPYGSDIPSQRSSELFQSITEEENEGKGIAKRLVFKVAEEAEKRKLKVIPVCSYAAKIMEKRPADAFR